MSDESDLLQATKQENKQYRVYCELIDIYFKNVIQSLKNIWR